MHATKSGWSGQAFAVATGNDSGGRKSRIRRSKEERKTMVESFIKKYQKSNNGNFPSLNLTHKEVGGSFYTVREIVRQIIQENRVLAPPRVSFEEDGHSEFLEQHPLGSISVEPQFDLSASDRIHKATHVMPNKYEFTSEENISSSSFQSNGSVTLEVNNTPLNQDTSEEEDLNRREQSPHPKTHEFEDEKIVNGFEVLEENTPGHQENNDSALLPSQKFKGKYDKENGMVVDKNEEFGQRIYIESGVVEILDREKDEAQDTEASRAIKSHTNSNVVVETFPLRPVPRTINNMDEESSNLRVAAGTLDDKAIQSDKMKSSRSSTDFVNEKREQKSSLATSNYPSAPKPSVLDIGDTADLESKDSLPDGTRPLLSENAIAVGRESGGQDNSNLPNGNNPMLDSTNPGTREGASKKPTESNPLLALVKAFITSFVKFWTE